MPAWQQRMNHERAWRDAGVELKLRRPPTSPDGPGFLSPSGPLRKSTPELDQLFAQKGHDSLHFETCSCHRSPPPNAPKHIGEPQ